MKILMCGSRKWTDRVAIARALLDALDGINPKDVTVIHGGADGADTISGQIAAALGCEVVPYRAEWLRYGNGAGPIRNQRMLDDGKPDLVLAFPLGGPGTADMLARASVAGVRAIMHTPGDALS